MRECVTAREIVCDNVWQCERVSVRPGFHKMTWSPNAQFLFPWPGTWAIIQRRDPRESANGWNFGAGRSGEGRSGEIQRDKRQTFWPKVGPELVCKPNWLHAGLAQTDLSPAGLSVRTGHDASSLSGYMSTSVYGGFYGSDCRKLRKFRSCSSSRSSTFPSWCRGRFPWSCCSADHGDSTVAVLEHGGSCPCCAGRAGSLPCRDAEADSHGLPCLADHRDFAVAVRARWSLSLLCRLSWIPGAVVKETVDISQLLLLRNRWLPVVLAALRGGVGMKGIF